MRESIIAGIIACIIAVIVWFVICYMQDIKKRAEKRKKITDEFRTILAHHLEEYKPRIHVHIRDDFFGDELRAWIEACGQNYYTKAEPDAQSMTDKAKQAADFFDKKQLMKWIPND